MTSDELDWLVYSYLEESGSSPPLVGFPSPLAPILLTPNHAGYHHTSFSLLHESSLAGPSTSSSTSASSTQPNGRGPPPSHPNPVMNHVVPPGHLVRLLQKGLLYLEAEAKYRGDPPEPAPRLVGYPIPSALPLPPLPKHKPKPAPPAPTPSPAAKPASTTPPASAAATTSTDAPAPAPALKDKGKGKEKEGAAAPATSVPEKDKEKPASAAAGNKRKGSDREDGGSEGKRPRTASGEATASGAGAGKRKGKEKEKEREVNGKGKEKEKLLQPASEDVAMEDIEEGEIAPTPARGGKAKEKAQEKERPKERDEPPQRAKAAKERDRTEPAALPSASTSSKRPTSSTTAASASATSSTAVNSSTSAANPLKRSVSPVVSRKPKPTPSDSTSITNAAPAPPPVPASSAPTSSGPAKIRITTTTRAVSTPTSPTHATAAEKRRAGSEGDELNARKERERERERERLLKVKMEEGEGGMKPPSSGAIAAAGRAKEKEKEREREREKEREKEKEKEKEKEREKDKALKMAEVDMTKVNKISQDDKRVIKLRGHTVAKVQPCAFNSKVPSLLATGGGDSTCRIWDVPSSSSAGQTILKEHTICKHASAQRRSDVAAVAWDPSGSLLATGSEDGIARIWTPSGDLHLVLSMHQRAIFSLKWSPNGTLLLTGSLDSTVCLWELSSGKVRQQYSTHGDSVLDVDWNDDSTFASASMDKTGLEAHQLEFERTSVFSTSRASPVHRFRGHRDEVNVVKFSPCGTLVASCSDDHTVRIWSLRNLPALNVAHKPVKKGDQARQIDDEDHGGVFVLEGHESDVHQIAWMPGCGREGAEGNRLIASCSFDHTAKLWDADAGTCLYTFARHSDYVYSIAFEPTLGRFLATGSNDGTVEVWRIEDRALVVEYQNSAPVYELTWHPHGTQLAVCGHAEDVAVIPLDSTPSE
ncbi:SPOSA6832_02256 [Sporobolomyces salmonicolor]|uniref:SPOSA6832_02256-mRNA-1:cds n=1 Tax=Sporidiobolus salmonicolor TaxID=5005 RepID=A0A0D6EKQ3_SPOSA|nr:SPOSA6832_02256 [Sporobolomyces salmonicolor]